MSGSKILTKLNSEELFDKLLEDDKKKLKPDNNQDNKISKEPNIKYDCHNEVNFEAENKQDDSGNPSSEFKVSNLSSKKLFDSNDTNLKNIYNPSEKSTVQSPKEKICDTQELSFCIENKIANPLKETRIMTEAAKLGSEEYCIKNKSVKKKKSISKLFDCMENSFSFVESNCDSSQISNKSNEAVLSYSISDEELLDQAIEDVVISNADYTLENCENENTLSNTYFKEGSHFGLIVPTVKSQSNFVIAEKSDRTKKIINNSTEKTIHNKSNNGNDISNLELDSSSKHIMFEETDTQHNCSKEEANNFDKLPAISNKPVFSSPKSKAFPDIYLHKDKINILRQMSQVFNNEKSPGNSEILDKCNKSNTLENADNLKKCSQNNLIDSEHILDVSPQNNVINSEHIVNKLNDNETIVDPRFNKSDITENISDNIELENKISAPVHLVSSTNNCIEKKIVVKSFNGKEGESIDVIDGFAFASFDSMEKLSNYKLKSKFKGRKLKTKSKLWKRLQKVLHKKKLNNVEHSRPISETLSDEPAKETNIVTETNRMDHESCKPKEELKNVQTNKKCPSDITGNKVTKKSNVDCFKVPNPPVFSSNQKRICIEKSLAKNKASIRRTNKNEILYLYHAGKLITLGGSINKLSPLHTEPLKGRVVLPNGLHYVDIRKRQAVKELSPIEITEDLAKFALSALQCPEQPLSFMQNENILTNMSKVDSMTKKSIPAVNPPRNNTIVVNKVNDNQSKVETSNKENLLTNNNEVPILLPTDPPSKIKWTQADVIKSSIGSSNAEKVLSSKKNIYRFPSLSREMKRLNMNFISYDKITTEEYPTCANDIEKCHKDLYCNLGCVCDSLKCRKIVPNHCGRFDCMFECTCQIGNLGGQGINISKANSVSILNLDKQHQTGLATREKEFKKTVVQSGSDIFLLEREKRKRDIKLPERYRDSDLDKTSEEPTVITPLVDDLFDTLAPVSYIPPHDYIRYVKKLQIELPWYNLPKTVSVWCMFHSRYDCKCISNQRFSLKCEDNLENLNSGSSDDVSDDEHDVKEAFEIGTQSSAIICQKLVRSNLSSLLENNQTYIFKYWIHNGEHHSARSCGYQMKNMKYENIEKMPYHYPEPSKPLVMGMTAKFSKHTSPRIKKSFKLSQFSHNKNPLLKDLKAVSRCPSVTFSSAGSKPTVNKLCDLRDKIKPNASQKDERSGTRYEYISLHWMIKEEEQRGELELDLCSNIPGRTIVVSEPRFKKLINMCIVGVVGLSSNHRCIISTVKSSEDLVKMQKIHHLIMNNTVDVGPNMKEIFSTQIANNNRYVMIRCDSIGRWEIFGVVQKKNGEIESSVPLKKVSPCRSSVIATTSESYRVNTAEPDQFPLLETTEATGNPHSSIVESVTSPIASIPENEKMKMAINSEILSSPVSNIPVKEKIQIAINSETLSSPVSNIPVKAKIPIVIDSEILPKVNFVNEIQTLNDGLPIIAEVTSLADSSVCSILTNDIDPSESMKENVASKATQSTINPVNHKIFPNVNGNIHGINLASVLPNESKITIKSMKEETKDRSLQQIKSSENGKFIVLPTTSKSKMKMIFVPYECESPDLKIVSKINSPSSPSPKKSLRRQHPYFNGSASNISRQRNAFRPSILSTKKQRSKNFHLDAYQPNINKCPLKRPVFNVSQSSEVGVPNVYNQFAELNNSREMINVEIEEMSKESLAHADLNKQCIEGDSKVDDVIILSENDVEEPVLRKLNSSDDLHLRLDSSDDDSSAENDRDNCSFPVNVEVEETQKCNKTPLRAVKKSSLIQTSLPTTSVEQMNSPDLEYISSQKLEKCSCIDMSINFKSVKLHWMIGTISKIVLSTITVQSEKRNVPISLVVESYGKIVKFYGLHCILPTSPKIAVLILGTDLTEVKKKSKQDVFQFFKANPVKYVIHFRNGQICTFTYDKSGLYLIRLKNLITRNGASIVDNKAFKIPVNLLRGLEFRNAKVNMNLTNKSSVLLNNALVNNKPNLINISKKKIIPLYICKPDENKLVSNSIMPKLVRSNFSRSTGVPITLKRKVDAFESDKEIKKKKLSNDIGVTACLGKSIESASSTLTVSSEDTGKVENATAESCNDLEVPSTSGLINSTGLFESGDKKSFGIACYDKISTDIDTTIDDDNIEEKVNSNAENNSLKLKCSRKQSLNRTNIRDFDTGSESVDDNASCSGTDSVSSGKKVRERTQRGAEEHNKKEKQRRQSQAVLFRILKNVISENSDADYRETAGHISKGNILTEAIVIITKEEQKSSKLVTQEMELRTERLKLMGKLGQFYPVISSSEQKKISEIIKNEVVYPTAKEEFMRKFSKLNNG